MAQIAPWPIALQELVEGLEYKPGWSFYLAEADRGQDSVGLTLQINVKGPDSYNPQSAISVLHYFIVPAVAYDKRAWMRWLFDQCVLVETHEACEFFKVDGERPFAPNHGPGRNPYSVLERGTEEDAYALADGSRNSNKV